MKRIGWIGLVLMALIGSVQAKDKVVKAPCFAACNTTNLEIEKVTLGSDTTWLSVRVYNRPGAGVRIDSTTVLRVAGKDYAYLGNEGMTDVPWTKVPESGELAATLKFEPIPQEAESFDFLEMPAEAADGWKIFEVRLDGVTPQPEIPAELLQQQLDSNRPLPEPLLQLGNSVLKGRLLGYNPDYPLKVVFHESTWFFSTFFGQEVKVEADGSFRVEVEMPIPATSRLRIGSAAFSVFMVPGGEVRLTLNLPALYRSQSRLLSRLQGKKKETMAWFEGDYAGLNTELMRTGGLKGVNSRKNYYEEICGMTPSAFKKYLLEGYKDLAKEMDKEKNLSGITRTFLRENLDLSLFSILYGYKSALSFAPMIAGKKGVKRADMTVDSTTYFNEALQLDILRSPRQRYHAYYVDFVRAATGVFRDRFDQDPLWNDILLGRRASRSLQNQMPLSEAERRTVDSIAAPELRQLFYNRSRQMEERLTLLASKTGYSVVEVPKDLAADSLLQVLARPYRGKVVLVDMWNTWCGPCMRAMKSLQPLKEELKEVVYLYIADETSPEGQWRQTIPDIHGIHCRITNAQSAALGKLYDYKGIPTYFVLNREGEIAYQVTGFPGVDTMREELTKAAR